MVWRKRIYDELRDKLERVAMKIKIVILEKLNFLLAKTPEFLTKIWGFDDTKLAIDDLSYTSIKRHQLQSKKNLTNLAKALWTVHSRTNPLILIKQR